MSWFSLYFGNDGNGKFFSIFFHIFFFSFICLILVFINQAELFSKLVFFTCFSLSSPYLFSFLFFVIFFFSPISYRCLYKELVIIILSKHVAIVATVAVVVLWGMWWSWEIDRIKNRKKWRKRRRRRRRRSKLTNHWYHLTTELVYVCWFLPILLHILIQQIHFKLSIRAAQTLLVK